MCHYWCNNWFVSLLGLTKFDLNAANPASRACPCAESYALELRRRVKTHAMGEVGADVGPHATLATAKIVSDLNEGKVCLAHDLYVPAPNILNS